jgi:hypothetical protein
MDQLFGLIHALVGSPGTLDSKRVQLSSREGISGTIVSESDVNIHVLDVAYAPFPTFEPWAAQTTVDTVRWDR